MLASSSPRRVALLQEIGCRFRQVIPQIDEKALPNEEPQPYARRLAREKAFAVEVKNKTEEVVVIGCDTVVILGMKVLGKPESESEAYSTLLELSGRKHVVATAVCLRTDNRAYESLETTDVYFNTLDHQEVRDYVATGEPMDKAGAYGIQGMGAFLVDRIEGNLDTVIGLPRMLLNELAGKLLRDSERS